MVSLIHGCKFCSTSSTRLKFIFLFRLALKFTYFCDCCKYLINAIYLPFYTVIVYKMNSIFRNVKFIVCLMFRSMPKRGNDEKYSPSQRPFGRKNKVKINRIHLQIIKIYLQVFRYMNIGICK